MSSHDALMKLLPGVPVIESPFFPLIADSDYFSEAEKPLAWQLYEKGYAVLEFPDSQINARAERIIKSLEPIFAHVPKLRDSGIPIDDTRVQDAFKFDEDVLALAINDNMLALLKKLYGRAPIPFQTLNFRRGSQQFMHTDSVHFSSNPERFMCGVWVALEEVDENNGPLFYYEGSHRWPIYTNEHIGLTAAELNPREISQQHYHQLWEQLTKRHEVRRKHLHAKPRTTLIWCANLLHGGEQMSEPDRTRWSQVTHYYFENCSYYTPMHSDVFLGNIMFREPDNILQGGDLTNSYNGHQVSDRFVQEARRGMTKIAKRATPALPEDFDDARYLALHPDVARDKRDAAEHYLMHGQEEGRRYK